MIKIVNIQDKYYDIYCGRGTALGNPYSMETYTEEDRNRVCDLYDKWFHSMKDAGFSPSMRIELNEIKVAAKDGDVILGCYCYPKRCHVETIKKYIETGE